MFIVLRLACWATAILFAFAPLALEIATTPHTVSKIFIRDSYATFGRDLIFLAIAVLAIGLVDALEAIILLRNRRTRISKIAFGGIFILMRGIFILMIAIFAQLFMYSFWSAHVDNKLSPEELITVLNLVAMSGISSLFARLTLVSAG